MLSRVQLFVTPWTVACQAPLSMGFSRQAYWSGWLFPPPGHLPEPGIKPVSPALQVDSLPTVPPRKPSSPYFINMLKTSLAGGVHVLGWKSALLLGGTFPPQSEQEASGERGKEAGRVSPILPATSDPSDLGLIPCQSRYWVWIPLI